MATKKIPQLKETTAKFLGTPRITEKATMVAEKNNVYTFNISANSTKSELMKEIKKLHKVTPVKINIANLPRKNRVVRGRKITKAGSRKAYVFLKKGDKIDLV
jgi:large subunit ribosomal protein L23